MTTGMLWQRIAIGSALILSSCSSMPLPETGPGVNFSSTLNFNAPATSMVGRRFETVVRQQYDFSCGSAALATLLSFHYEDPQNEQSVFLGMWRDGDREQIRRLGFSLLDMKRYLAGRGIAADGYKVTLEQVATARVPGIALINYNGYRHFVVVKAVDRDTLLLGDPSLGLRREKISSFKEQWNGVFFVLSGNEKVARAHFAMARDEVRAPEGRIFPGGSPLDLAALALTRPVLGEF